MLGQELVGLRVERERRPARHLAARQQSVADVVHQYQDLEGIDRLELDCSLDTLRHLWSIRSWRPITSGARPPSGPFTRADSVSLRSSTTVPRSRGVQTV